MKKITNLVESANYKRDSNIDNFAPVKAYVVYWDINYEVVSQVTMYAETLYPINLTRAVEVFKPKRAAGANVVYEMITGDITETVICVF